MVRNIIEDSDDEGDFGALSPIASRPASPTPPDAPDPDAPTHIQRTAPATSSTEELRRDIAAAHQEVLDKSALPNGTVNSVNGSGHWSSPVASRKRKAALLSLESNGTPSSERPEPRKTNKTYGNSDRMGHSFFDDNNDVFEAMKEEETARTSGYNGVSIQPHETSETWYMVGNDQAVLPEMAHSLQEDFVLHDPAVMFPTTMSSTIPDATISQQQLVEAARAEYRQNQLGSRNLTAKILENPSVSWSDRLESTEKEMRSSQTGSGKSQQQFQRSSQPTNTQSSQRDKYGSDGTKDDAFASPATVKSKKSTRRSKTTPHPRLSQSSHDELGDEAFPAESMSSSKRPNPSIEGITASQRAIDDSVKESIRAVRASKAAKAKVQESSDALNSDDLAIGLPKERYVPRPSRSRSERSTVEEPDYSMIPEKAAKAKGKRQKTVEPLPEDPKEIESVGDGDSGNRVLQEDADRELNDLSGRKHKSDQDEDVVITGGSTSVRPVQKNTPAKAKRKRGRPPKTSPIEALGDAIAENNTLENTQLGDVDELQQVMPLSGSGHDVDPHSAHKEQLLHDPDFTEDATRPRLPSPFVQPTPTSSLRKIEEEGEMQLVETKAKKKGRGRPRSAKNAEAGATNVDKPKVTAEDPPHDEEVKSQEIQPNTKLKEERSHDDQKIAEGGEAERGAQSDAAAALGPSGSPKQPSEEHEVGKGPAEQRAAASRESVQPSPLGKGKVPVRVGLSRRARIAPLLKIVKK